MTFFLIAGALSLYFIIPLIYKPDLNVILEEARKISFLNIGNFKPEPVEKLTFVSIFFSMPIFGIIYLKYIRPFTDLFLERHKIFVNFLSYTLITLLVIIIVFPFFFKMEGVSASYSELYLFAEFYGSRLYYFSIIVLTFLFLCTLCIKERESLEKLIDKYHFIIFLVFVLITLSILYKEHYPTTLLTPSTKFGGLHFNALFYSQYQLLKEHIPLGIDGASNTYGFYPYFLEIVFTIIPLSVISFKNVFIVLVGLTYLFAYLFFNKVIKNHILSLSMILVYMYYMSIYGYSISYDMYFQYNPLRLLFPFFIMYLISLYHIDNRRRLFFIIGVVIALAILWNPESGIMSMLLWFTYLTWKSIEPTAIARSISKIFFDVVKTLLLVAIVFLSFKIAIFYIYGSWINYQNLFEAITMFSKYGYFLLPIPHIHPYIGYLALVMLSFALILGSIQKKIDVGLVLFGSWSIATFMYYQGRSHDYTFLSIFINMILLMAFIINDFSLQGCKKSIIAKTLTIPYGLVASFFISSFIIFIVRYSSDPNYRINTMKDISPYDPDVAFIKKYSRPNEKILILDSYEQGLLYSATDTLPVNNIGLVDMFLRKDFNHLIKIIQNTKNLKIFLSRYDAKVFKPYIKNSCTFQKDDKVSLYYIKVNCE